MIKDLQPKQGSVSLEADVIEMGPVREFQKFGKPGRVCTAVIKDDSGQCNLSLWNEQIDQVKAGDKIKITDGFASEWQGNIQVTTGRNGTLEVESGAATQTASSDEKTEEPSLKEEVEEEKI